MTEIGSLLLTPSKDTLVSDLENEEGGQLEDIVQIVISERYVAGHQQTGLAPDGSAESNETLNAAQENEASNTNADSKHPSLHTKAPMSLTNGPSTPIVKKASVYNISLFSAFYIEHLRLSILERSVLVLSSQLLVPKSLPPSLRQVQRQPLLL